MNHGIVCGRWVIYNFVAWQSTRVIGYPPSQPLSQNLGALAATHPERRLLLRLQMLKMTAQDKMRFT